MSFAVISDDGSIVGICPVIREGAVFRYQGGPCPEPLYDNDSARNELLQHLRSVIDAYEIDSYDFMGSIGGDAAPTEDISWKTRIIDLQPVCEIELIRRWLDVRKSYKSLINNCRKTHRIERSVDPRDVGILHDLHREQSGRETRPQRTWDLMSAWVHGGHAYLCTAWNTAGVCDGAAYIYAYKDQEYYGHAATTAKDVNHALLWKAINTSTADTFEVGWQGHFSSVKEQNIEFFRRGFGGINKPFTVSRMYA
jgi:hypothetical protein|tara:strand:- start:1815 stop:2573 length:759 start_codon:yes stop_codon:yes gene_type:complete